jgi:hypothetical protein
VQWLAGTARIYHVDTNIYVLKPLWRIGLLSDRATHLKIVVVALIAIAATALAGFSLVSHVSSGLASARTAVVVVTAGMPVA